VGSQPNIRAPRCLPCNHSIKGESPMQTHTQTGTHTLTPPHMRKQLQMYCHSSQHKGLFLYVCMHVCRYDAGLNAHPTLADAQLSSLHLTSEDNVHGHIRFEVQGLCAVMAVACLLDVQACV